MERNDEVFVGNLAFIGGGEIDDDGSLTSFIDINSKLFDLCKNKSVHVLATALAYESKKKRLSQFNEVASSLGVSVNVLDIYARGDAQDESKIKELDNAEVVYILDGSSLHLRSVLKDSLLWSVLVDKWNSGVSVIGCGAGAIILGDPMVDPRGGAFTLGLGLVKNFSVVPHWERWTSESARRMSELIPANAVVIEIPENTALIRSSIGEWISIGSHKPVITYQKKSITLLDIEKNIDIQKIEKLYSEN